MSFGKAFVLNRIKQAKAETQMQDRGIRDATQTTGLGNLPRLLVIDDELVQRTIISKIGQQVGYEVLAVASFEDATLSCSTKRRKSRGSIRAVVIASRDCWNTNND